MEATDLDEVVRLLGVPFSTAASKSGEAVDAADCDTRVDRGMASLE